MQGFVPASQREEQVQTLRAYRHLTPNAIAVLAGFGSFAVEPHDDNAKGWATDLYRLGLLDRARGKPYRYKLTDRGQNVLALARYSGKGPHAARNHQSGSLRIEHLGNHHKPSNVHTRQMIDQFLKTGEHSSPSGMTAAVLLNFCEEAGVDYDLKVRGGTYYLKRVPFAENEDAHFQLDRS